MRRLRRMCSLGLLAAVLASAPVLAQEAHVVTPTELDELVSERADAADADRAALEAFLDRPEVQRIATQAGLDLRTAASAVAVLDEEEAERLAAKARDLDEALAGGQDYVVISTTALIIALLILLIIVAS